jgi:DNA invertase Pin-like site-specific DNA recombinase
VIIDEDQGQTAKQAVGRDGFQGVVADISLRKLGIIAGYEVSRLSRNNADWFRVLELCALFDTLVLDYDGIYNLRDFNDRPPLGLKGTISEAELHSLRLRLDAGRLSKLSILKNPAQSGDSHRTQIVGPCLTESDML